MPPARRAHVAAVLVAAGGSRRMGRDKLWIEVAGRPVWRWSLDLLLARPDVRRVAVVVPAAKMRDFADLVADGRCVLVAGGTARAESVAAGLDALASAGTPDDAIVLVHDAARPAATPDLVQRLVDAMTRGAAAAVPAVAARDSLWRASGATEDGATLDAPVARDGLLASQTPQAARLGPLREALAAARERGLRAGDEAAALSAAGVRVTAVAGEAANMKLTEPGDERIVELILRAAAVPLAVEAPLPVGARAGIGFDAHRLVAGGELRIAGVAFPDAPRGLEGHSDGDVALHAVIDALLGAAALGDIGGHFPAADTWRGADSSELLGLACRRAREAGWRPSSVDLTVVAAWPRIAPRTEEMRHVVGRAVGIPPEAVNVKATTTDGLGFPAGEGIAAYASVVVVPIGPAG